MTEAIEYTFCISAEYQDSHSNVCHEYDTKVSDGVASLQ